MKKTLLAVILGLCSFTTTIAQDAEGKPVVYVEFFAAPANISKSCVEALRNKVIEGIQETNRVEIRDVASTTELNKEAERRMQESAMADATARNEQMRTLGANFIITADIAQMTGDRKTDSNGKVYYRGNIKWTIKVIDAADGTLHTTKAFDHSGIASNSGDTPEKAVVATCSYAKALMDDFVDDTFPIEGTVLKIETTNKKGDKAETVYIDLGSARGIAKGQKMTVFLETDIAGEIAQTEIGTLTAQEVVSGKRTLCKVSKGGDKVLEANKNDQKLTVRTRKARTFLDKI